MVFINAVIRKASHEFILIFLFVHLLRTINNKYILKHELHILDEISLKMEDEVEDVEDYLERSLRVQRRSVFLLDPELQEFGQELITNLGQATNFSDENLLESVAKTFKSKDGNNSRRIDALSVEITPSARSNNPDHELAFRFRHSICITGEGEVVTMEDTLQPLNIVCDILDQVIETAVASANETKVELYFFHPLAGGEDVRRMEKTFTQTASSLSDHATRLRTAMKIILVMSAQQIVVSYRRILIDQAQRLADGEPEEQVAMETCKRLLDVTETVSEMAVTYLKNATRDIVDSSVNDVKIILGKMNENEQIEEVTRL